MPVYRPDHNCEHGTCRNVAVAGSKYCGQHQKETPAASAAPEKKRQPWWHAWYNKAVWKRLRLMILARDPICKICNRRPSTDADHIKPHRGIWKLFVDPNNLQGACHECHSQKTASEDSGFGNQPKDSAQPVATGADGKQFSSSSIGEDALDRALREL